jgi:hypothetical protein
MWQDCTLIQLWVVSQSLFDCELVASKYLALLPYVYYLFLHLFGAIAVLKFMLCISSIQRCLFFVRSKAVMNGFDEVLEALLVIELLRVLCVVLNVVLLTQP